MPEGSQPAVQAVNLLDDLEATLRSAEGDGRPFPIAPILRPGESSDVTVIVRDEAQAAGVAALLEGDPAIASVWRERQRFALRYDDERIAELGAALEAGGTGGIASMAADDLLAGEPYVVDFCDPNATKALHVGHLRNIALGHAIASMTRAAGAQTICQSHVGDAGRSMGEAMAGWVRYAEGATPASTGRKSDQFVGDLYARYVRETAVPVDEVDPEDVAVARDIGLHDDLAQELLERLERGEPDAVELWRTVRGWAVAGQEATLARLGVHFDRIVYDSDFTPHVEGFVEIALAAGVISRAPSGALGYETGQQEYAWLPLSRADGFPTQNLRGLVMWHRLRSDIPDRTLVHLSGLEWRTHTIHVEDMLRELQPEVPVYPTTHVRHGMVTIEGGVVSSSAGDALLIDGMLDALDGQEQLHALAHPGRPGCEAADLAAIALLASFLNRPVVKELLFDPGHVLDAEANVGWRIAQAWSRANDPANDGAPDADPGDDAYRFFVMQSQVHRRLLARAIDQLDAMLVLRFLAHVSEWYMGQQHAPRCGRVVRTILREGLGAIGLLRAASGEA
jgi:arginyl-tRNA synthetase